MESASKTSGPPHASSWAAPPEFYADENVVTKSVVRFLRDLGYVLHTPAELFGSRAEAQGTDDEVWLARVSPYGWACLSRDAKILKREDELEAYRRAQLHLFLLPGEATSATLTNLVSTCLADTCTAAVGRPAQCWKLTASGLTQFPIPPKRQRTK